MQIILRGSPGAMLRMDAIGLFLFFVEGCLIQQFFTSRRSQSPNLRPSASNYRPGGYPADPGPEGPAYPPGGAPYSSSAGYTGDGYTGGPPAAARPTSVGGNTREREYPLRNGGEPASSYTRRP